MGDLSLKAIMSESEYQDYLIWEAKHEAGQAMHDEMMADAERDERAYESK